MTFIFLLQRPVPVSPTGLLCTQCGGTVELTEYAQPDRRGNTQPCHERSKHRKGSQTSFIYFRSFDFGKKRKREEMSG